MSTENEQEQTPQLPTKQPKYFMVIVKDEGYTCPEERTHDTNEVLEPEEYLPPAANAEQWWFENSEFCGLCGGNTIESISEISEEAIKSIVSVIPDSYKPVYLTDEEQKSIEESSINE